MSGFLIGASYYPEWWKEEEWEEDFSKMEELGFTAVRMGEFAWSWFEPKEGEYNFAPMLKVLDIAQKHGISVIMGTVTAVCPAWLHKKYPEVKGGNERGNYDFGGRKGQCLSSRIFLEYAEKITTAQAKALGNHPALAGWQLDNEPGFPFHDYDDCCREGFRSWLKEKYGTIEELNKAWFTQMWSNAYTDFDEIDIPVNACEGGWSPEVSLDYRRYFSFTFNRLLRMEAGIVRKYSPGRFIYTNWPGANWSVNCFEATEYLDYAAWDNYVPQPNRENYRIQLRASMEHSFDRRLSCGKHAFLVAEQHGYADADTYPEVIQAQTWLNVSHGAFGTIFFEWRTPNGGAEQGYGSVIYRDKSFREDTTPIIKRLCADIKKVYPLIEGAQTRSAVACIYSYENSWGTSGWTVDGFYDEEFFNAYGGFKNALATDIDVIGIDDDFSQYKVLVIPNHRIMTPAQVERIKEFTEKGGIAVFNFDCATRVETNQLLELNAPGLLAPLAGAYVTTSVLQSTVTERTGRKVNADFGEKKAAPGSELWKVILTGASPAAVYDSSLLKGTPAVTVNKAGEGFAVMYASNGNDVYYYEALAEYVNTLAKISPLCSREDGVIVSSRIKGDSRFVMAMNMKDRPVVINPRTRAKEILTGHEMNGPVKMEKYSVAVWEEKI